MKLYSLGGIIYWRVKVNMIRKLLTVTSMALSVALSGAVAMAKKYPKKEYVSVYTYAHKSSYIAKAGDDAKEAKRLAKRACKKKTRRCGHLYTGKHVGMYIYWSEDRYKIAKGKPKECGTTPALTRFHPCPELKPLGEADGVK